MAKITEWNSANYQGGDGILIASDINQEWMLKWWWKHYSKYNDFPVTFCDTGMSKSARIWCESKGTVVSFPLNTLSTKKDIPEAIQKKWEIFHSERIWDCRQYWLHKPFFILQSPYDRTIWTDTDCEINNSLQPLFSYCDTEDGISMVQMEIQNYIAINSGVIVAKRKAPIFSRWVEVILKHHHELSCEEKALMEVHKTTPFKIKPLPFNYNFINYWKTNSPVQVYHHGGSIGKREILKQIQ